MLIVNKFLNFKRSNKKESVLFIILIYCFTNSGYGQLSQTKSANSAVNILISGSSSQWTNLSNAFLSDNSYATLVSNLFSSGDYSDYLQLSNFNFSLPAGSVINGIKINIERSDANGKTKDYRARLVKSGLIRTTDKALNPSWSSTDNIQSYGGTNDLWGETITSTDINSANFGFAFSVKRTGGGTQATFAKIDHISITVFYSVILPIELIYFDVKTSGYEVNLSWQTASEVNNNFFTIEKSVDGILFQSLKTIEGKGNSFSTNEYFEIDQKPFFGISYYRLKQTDYNGLNTYSQIKSLEFEKTSNTSFYPNPFYNQFHIEYSSQKPTIILISIYNLMGHLVHQRQYKTTEGFNKFTFNDIKFSKGLYSVFILDTNSNSNTVFSVIQG